MLTFLLGFVRVCIRSLLTLYEVSFDTALHADILAGVCACGLFTLNRCFASRSQSLLSFRYASTLECVLSY
jgi:hypothetical protein